jgi:hypothetical protein
MNVSTLPAPAATAPTKAKAKAKAKAETLKTLPADVAAAITAHVKGLMEIEKGEMKLVDLMVIKRIKPKMLVAPEKGKDRTFYESVRIAVVAGFPPIAQSLLTADAKTLVKTEHAGESAQDKLKPTTGNRAYWQKQIGSKIKDLKVSLENRLAKNTNPQSAGKKKTTLEQRIIRDLKKYASDVKKAEAFKGDAVKMIASLQACLQYVNE